MNAVTYQLFLSACSYNYYSWIRDIWKIIDSYWTWLLGLNIHIYVHNNAFYHFQTRLNVVYEFYVLCLSIWPLVCDLICWNILRLKCISCMLLWFTKDCLVLKTKRISFRFSFPRHVKWLYYDQKIKIIVSSF